MELRLLARQLVENVQAEARSLGLQVTVWIVDQVGQPVLVERMEGAGPLTVDMAERKAITAAFLGIATAELAALVQPGQPLYGLTHVSGGKFVAFGGGRPLHDDNGRLIGGVGVSGGSVDQDTAMVDGATDRLQHNRWAEY